MKNTTNNEEFDYFWHKFFIPIHDVLTKRSLVLLKCNYKHTIIQSDNRQASVRN